MLIKLITGGQTGVDQWALKSARKWGINTAGYAPKGYLTETGPAKWLKTYHLLESPSANVFERTIKNLQQTDILILCGSQFHSPGTAFTQKCAENMKIPIWMGEDLFNGIPILNPQSTTIRINVSGPRESEIPEKDRHRVHNQIERLIRHLSELSP